LEINQGYTTMHGQPVIKLFMSVWLATTKFCFLLCGGRYGRKKSRQSMHV